ncbi:deoxyribodipyrimidine photolyase [Rubidibacter lacunae KORDI 51-2]|uniref:Deoxyribodipyrimidine photolyase n=1 Tax=Rubidibacter lacunae KORDI 51-2 TaxID=582515 RepID=U5DL39_9CHRO|nr:FAD-binding domain-containing protein [Rubidibacter lacunae]ERN40440.1 deoxyribodipyrimidine photolyase [Rubidibacter lacunae KORDI 51-2]
MNGPIHVVWFRRDLRLRDNEAIARAAIGDVPVLPCFVVDPWFYEQPEISAHRVRFLFESLADLDTNLRERGNQLYIFSGTSVAVLQKLTQQLQAQGYRPALFFNRDVQVPYGVDRDRAIARLYREQKLPIHLGLNYFLQPDGDRRSEWRDRYYSYLRQPQHPTPKCIVSPNPLTLDIPQLGIPQLSFADLQQKYAHLWENGTDFFRGGETRAQAALGSFLESRYQGYHWKISHPWLTQRGATSHLSPHLTWGTISTRDAYQRTKARAAELADNPKATFALKQFRDRLRWRDSAAQRLYLDPHCVHHNLYPEFDDCYTETLPTDVHLNRLQAWQNGRTGFPLVDATMRQLRAIGWTNFRMRAMCATFLTINCGISWHHGALHYMNCLVDGDLAIDHWQWQAQAGITNPLAKTFRIYNPTKNLQEKDADLRFVHYWVPELRGYSLPDLLAGRYLGKCNYPAPILDWNATRLINGKRVSDLRAAVRDRLQHDQQHGSSSEYLRAAKAKEITEKYRSAKDEQFRAYKQQELALGLNRPGNADNYLPGNKNHQRTYEQQELTLDRERVEPDES